MSKIKKKNLNVICIILVVLFAGILIFVFNYFTPIINDDYSYTFSFYDGQRITSVSDIIRSMNAHYYSMNGRYVTHFLAQIFLLLGGKIFDVINTAAFLLLGFVACFHAVGSFGKIKAQHLLFAYSSMFLFAPAFAESFLWTVGASNYLYGILIILICLIPFRLFLSNGKIKSFGTLQNVILAAFMLIFGAVAGATNENNSVSFIAVMIIYIIWALVKERKAPLWMFSSLVGGIAGCLTILLSPGENKRLDEEGGIKIISLFNKTIHCSCTFVDYFAVLFLICALLAVVIIKRHYPDFKNNGAKSGIIGVTEKYFAPIIYFIGTLGGVYSMIVAPYFPDRVWSGPLMFMIIAVLGLYNELEFKTADLKKFGIAAALILSVSALGTYADNVFNLYYTNNQFNQRSAYIQEQVESGQSVVEIPAITGTGKYTLFGSGDLVYDSDEWPNVSIAAYYGAEKIVRNDNVSIEQDSE